MSENNVKTAPAKMPQRRGGPMGGGGMHGMMGQKPKNFKASMGKLIRFLKPWAVPILLSVIIVAGATVVSILAPGKIKDLTKLIYAGAALKQLGIGAVDLVEVGKIGITLVIFYATVFLCNFTQNFVMAGVNARAAKSLRKNISVKINKVPLNYYDTHATGDIMSRVSNDVDTIGQTLNQSLAALIRSVIMLVGTLIAMFVTSWQMALAAVVTVPLSVIFLGVLIKFSQKYHKEQAKQTGMLNGIIEENYSAQNIVKAFNGQKKAAAEFDAVNGKLAKVAAKSSFLSMGVMMPVMTFVSNLGFVAVCVVGGLLMADASDPQAKAEIVGMIASFLIYLRLFQNPLSEISQAMGNLQSTAASAERVFEFLDAGEQTDESGKPSVKADEVKGKVEFKNVRFGYNAEKTVINNFSATVEPGQKVAIVGPTGAGKTTMVNLLMRFYEINEGEILIDGTPTSAMRREDVRALFGMVLQDSWLFEGTIEENIIYAKQGVTHEEVVAAAKAANVNHYIRTLPQGYNTVLSDEVNISGGQRQLLTIARAMVQNSPMLILDEATSNVDTRTEQLIQDAMDKVTRGRTSFVIAHRLSTIKNADLILVMKEGDIIESGTHETLLAQNGFYAELYNSQFSFEAE